MTPKPFWLAAALALPLAAPAARAAEANRPSMPKCLAHAKALCFWHHPACLALDMAASYLPFKLECIATPDCPRPGGYSARPACPLCCPPAAACASPPCACAPTSSWAASSSWQPPVLPPPVPVGASMPCAAPPVPYPAPGCFPGTTPATALMPVCAEPMPVYVPCCAASGAAPVHYVIETKLLRAGPDGVIQGPASKCMTAEGAPVQVAVHGPPGHPGRPAGALSVCAVPAGKHKVGLEVFFECCHAYTCGKNGERMLCDCARVCRTVAVGKTTYIVLRKAPDGAEEACVEVTVTEAPHAGPERIARAPLPVPPTCPGTVAAAVGEVCGCRAAAAGMTLPSGKYVNHPPQYVPPSPAFPLPRERATQEAVWMAPPPVPPPAWPGMMMPPPMPVPVLAVPAPAPSRPAAGSVVRAVCTEGKPYLEVRAAGAPRIQCKSMVLEAPHGDAVKLTAGNGRVVVRGPDMKAWADGVRTAGKHRIVLEGHVRLVSHRDGHEARIKADVLEVSLVGEHVEVRPTADAE